jgi:ADP-heptose:LPS heptosyltransferase
MVEMLGIACRSDLYPQVTPVEQENDIVTQLFRAAISRPPTLLIGISPGAGNLIKYWPSENFVRLANLLIEQLQATIVFFGTQREASEIEDILQQINFSQQALSLAGKLTIDQFFRALKKCDFFLGNNSGPVHMAGAMGIPALNVNAGNIDSREWGP